MCVFFNFLKINLFLPETPASYLGIKGRLTG